MNPKTQSQNCIVCTGGGTAGHVFPHQALFDHPSSNLRKVYIGSLEGPEKQWMQHWEYYGISSGKFRRYKSFYHLIDPFFVILGFLQSLRILFKIKPQLVFSKGGYVSAPVVWAAWCLRIPIVIHESDRTLALTTRLTALFATQILITFPDTKTPYPQKTQCLGLPLREELFIKDPNLIKMSQKPLLCILGGSLGALGINKKIHEILPQLLEKMDILHIVGKGKETLHSEKGYTQKAFLESQEMAALFQKADIILTRGGATALFECATAKIPMVIVPLGNKASRGDQLINAEYFQNKGWGKILSEEDSAEQWIKTILEVLENRNQIIESFKDGPSLEVNHRIRSYLETYFLK